MATVVTEIGVSANFTKFSLETVVNPPSLTSSNEVSFVLSLDDVSIGDSVHVVMPYDSQQVNAICHVQGEGTVHLYLYNAGPGTVDLAPGLWKFIITKP